MLNSEEITFFVLAFLQSRSMVLFQIYAIVTSKGNPIIAASGIQVDANCRRFVVDERRDQYYRAEVQNRVYKREVVEVIS